MITDLYTVFLYIGKNLVYVYAETNAVLWKVCVNNNTLHKYTYSL